MFTLYATVQKYISKKSGRCYCVYVDFTQAFDTIPHSHLWFKLIEKGVHGKILSLLRQMYSKLKSCVKTTCGLTEFFECTIGTRQGCMISPFLFILYIDELVDMLRNSGCPGVFINEEVPSLHILMFADDVTLLNDTIGRVQTQLNVLQSFSNKFGLKVNINKTKLMVFRNGGPLRQNEKLYFDGKLVEPVTYYKYLGLIFSSRLSWSKTISTLRHQAEKAIIAVKIIFNKCGGLPTNVAFHLFDTLVLPILCYGSEIWGYQCYADIEIVHGAFCKYILGTSSQTPNSAVLGECGRLPLYTHYKVRCIKFWLKILKLDSSRLPRASYDMLYSFDNVGRKNWATEIKHMLYGYGFGEVWVNQSVGDVNMFLYLFKQRVVDVATQEWHSEISTLPKLISYCQFKYTLSVESYLDVISWKRHKIALARFRCGNHQLSIERNRGILDRNQRLCPYCIQNNIAVIEDEYHFLLICPLYNHIRLKFSKLSAANKNVHMFIHIMKSSDEETIRQTASYIYHSMSVHRIFNNIG